MLEGLPDLGLYIATLMARRPLRGPLDVVVLHHLGDLVNAAHFALGYYSPINLDKYYPQGSTRFRNPHQKWAFATNEAFRVVDECLRRLLIVVATYYFDSNDADSFDECCTRKDAWTALNSATTYVCCKVDPDVPRLTRSALHLTKCVDWQSTRFLNLWNKPRSERQVEALPDEVTTEVVDIKHRSVVARLYQEGLERLAELRHVHEGLRAHLRATLTMDDVTAPHKGTLSECQLSLHLRPGIGPA